MKPKRKQGGGPPEVYRMLRDTMSPAAPPWGADGVPEMIPFDAQAGAPTAVAGGQATVARVVSPDDPQPGGPQPFAKRR